MKSVAKSKPLQSRKRSLSSEAYQALAAAPATLRAYASDVRRFTTWCKQRGFKAMPASAETVAAYLAEDGPGYAMASLRRRVAAIAHASAAAGAQLNPRDTAIRATLSGIARAHRSPRRQATALTAPTLRLLSEACGDTLAGARDRAMFLLAFAGALRRSELTGLDVENLRWTTDGVILHLAHSKTDQEGEGASVPIPLGSHPATCPPTALRTWLERSKIQSGPIFRKVTHTETVTQGRLTGEAVRAALLKRAAGLGITVRPNEMLSPHGFRAGFITASYDAGTRDEDIMGHTRHKSLATMRGYVRRKAIAQTNPAKKIGL